MPHPTFAHHKLSDTSNPHDVVNHSSSKGDHHWSSKLSEEETPQPPLPELKPLPASLKYAFLHNNRATPVVISDKLTESETRVAVLEKYRSVIGYSLQDLKGISPNLCTHRIPMEPEHKPSREHQRRLNDAMRGGSQERGIKTTTRGYHIPRARQ